ncbi:Solute carrier family protein [Spironucleus salmonicida]|uniref:Solute carrier family protein n=1 Tax=Spironucleus salmonicida TaxID=348837 RepID=V6M6C7_9EUKA|nr:Solute carrier family protein [Spironucleus salmonicida]|eukprot:EST48954.1 Transmembrane amino acid transporter protein [Spironucleus salmonicida]
MKKSPFKAKKQSPMQINKVQLLGTILTLSNTMMGAALLSLPYTFSRVGWPLAIAIAVFAFVFSIFGFMAIIDAAHYTQSPTMRGMIKSIFGNIVATIIDSCIAFMYCGYLVSYISICSDYLVVFIQAVSSYHFNPIYMKICLFAPLAPLTMLSSPSALSNVSAFAIIFIVVTVFATFSYFIKGLQDTTTDIVINQVVSNIKLPNPLNLVAPAHKNPGYAFLEFIQRIPLFMPLFGCHASIPVLLHDLAGQPNYRRQLMKKSCVFACILVCVLYLLNAFSAYFLFGRQIAGNVLLSFSPKNYVMTTVRLLYAFVIMLSYVVIVYPIRAIFMEWFRLDRTSKKGTFVFFSIGILLTIFAIGVSILVPSIVTVFNSVAALFGIAVYWVIPLIARWKNPELQRKSGVPKTDDAEQQQRASIAIRRLSLIGVFVAQNRKIDSAYLAVDRVRSRSEIQHEIVENESRERSNTAGVFGPFQVGNVIACTVKSRSRSIAEALPTCINDQMVDLQHEGETTISQAMAAIHEVEIEVQAVEIEIRAIMTKSRLMGLCCACSVIVCINLTAFVLSTFFDMSSSRFPT